MAGETLKITGGNAAGQTITLEQELVIGRSTPGLGSLGGDSEISRVHARVFHDPSGRLMIEDLGSTNGTFVNGNRVSGQQPLNPGDQVRVGQTSLTVEGGAADTGATSVGQVIPAAPAAAPAAAAPPTQPLPPQQPLGGPPGGPPPGGPGFGGGPVGGPPQRAGGGGTNRNLLIALAALVVVALVVAGLAIGGVFSSDDNKSDTNTTAQTTPTTTTSTTDTSTTTSTTPSMPVPTNTDTQTPPTSQGSFPPKIKQQFIDGCSRSGKLSASQCGCIVNKAEKQYSLVEFLTALKATQAGNAPPKLVSIIRSCT
jgi:hypothetical protein